MAVTLVAAIVAGGVVGAACGSGDDGATRATAVERGAAVASDHGCAACHGDVGQGGVGPSWQGLAESTVELEDGTEVVADTDYIRRSIVDSQADQVAGYTVQMPQIDLSGDDVDTLVAYIQSLG